MLKFDVEAYQADAMTINENLLRLREDRGLTQAEVARGTGIDQSMVSRHESGDRVPGRKLLDRYATFYGVTVDEILGRASTTTSSRHFDVEAYPPGPMVLLPVYEEAAAGSSCFVDERPVDRRPVDAMKVQNDLPNYILVIVRGDSMIMKGIMPGGMVLVHKQDVIEDNQIAVVRLRDDGVTIKRVRYMDGGRVMLIPEHPTMRETIHLAEDVTICGRVIQAITDID
jgi:repressor LexA